MLELFCVQLSVHFDCSEAVHRDVVQYRLLIFVWAGSYPWVEL